MPPFQKGALDAYRDAMAEAAGAVLDNWRTNCVRDVSQDALELIYHITGRVLYGLDADEVRRLDEVIDPWLDLNGRMLIAADLMTTGGAGSYAELLSRSGEVEGHFRSLIDRRRQSTLGNDFVSLLVRLNRENPTGMSDVQMIGHLVQFFSVSFHSTRDVLIWALFLLAQHPDAAADLLDELTAELRGGAPTADQQNRLPFLDGVVKEAMRLFPPLVYYSRTNREPLDLGGLSLKPGTTIVFSHYVTHRLPDLYPQPDRFRPDRWRTAPAAPYAFLPFGSGPRMCLGAAFATMAVKLTLAMIWQRFRLTVVRGARIDRRVMITLFPKTGVPMLVSPQDRRFSASPVCGDVLEMVDLSPGRPNRVAA